MYCTSLSTLINAPSLLDLKAFFQFIKTLEQFVWLQNNLCLIL